MPTNDSSSPLPPTREDFQICLDEVLDNVMNNGQSSIVVQSGCLHKIVGGYPGKHHRMPMCCRVMRNRMQKGDKELPNSLKNYGASLQICYQLKK